MFFATPVMESPVRADPEAGSKPGSTSSWSVQEFGSIVRGGRACSGGLCGPGKQGSEPYTTLKPTMQHPRRFGSSEDVALMPY